ncbi:hypothetical protein MKW92_026051, partial [Papaver armeniacum]
EQETGKWWLILDDIKVGYWPELLFPLFTPGVNYVFWGGRVKAGLDGVSPPMASGMPTDGYFTNLQYKDESNQSLKPERVNTVVDCNQPVNGYNAEYDSGYNIVHFGGAPGGVKC